MRSARNVWAVLAVAVLAASCASYRLEREVRVAEQIGDWDQAVLHYIELVRAEPGNIEYRAGLLRAKLQASLAHFELAKKYQEAGQLERALVELQEAVQLDPTNQYAQVELEKVRELLKAAREQRDYATSLDTLKQRTRGALAQPPTLDPRSDEPIDLDFPEPVSVMDIYRALGKAFGINVLFDPRLRDQEIAIELKQVTAQDALEILMRASGHFYKVVDQHSIIIAADTPQNRRAYEDLMIQTFFLSNSEVRDVMTMLRSLVDSRKVAANERLNAIILRDTADRVKVAERLIETNDKARAEVVIDVELMQINSSKLRELGMSLDPGYQLGFTLDGEQVGGDDEGGDGGRGAGAVIRLSELEFIDSSSWLVTIPSFLVDFVKDNTDAQILAKPQLRISEGEKANLVIGDRVPIPVTSFNTGNTIGGNIVPLTSFQYTDVGITIDIQPRVHHNNEVTLEVGVEVSNISGNIGNQPIIGTRNITTTIRLKDGETNFLAGLIRTDELQSETGIPGLADIPILGRLFSRRSNQVQRTDIVLTLTPHIIRRADITAEDLLPIWVGTETNFSFRGGSPRVESETEGPFDGEMSAEDAAQERLRQQLEQLPPGLRQDEAVPEESEPPSEEEREERERDRGIELAPSSGLPRRPSLNRPTEEEPENQSALEPVELPDVLEPAEPPEDGVLFASVTPRDPGGGVRLALKPARPEVAMGETFDVTLEVAAETAVSHLPVTLAYDPEALELLEAAPGTFFGDETAAQTLIDTATAGRVVLGASRLGRTHGVAGRGELLTLRFRARRPGAAEVWFEKKRALDAFLDVVGPLSTLPAKVVVTGGGATAPQSPTSPPEPPLDRVPNQTTRPESP
ncbi:MAG TPA: secretin N-terminal domain-containing protein [Thermoanaerobaculia bacterium]|nr:secretin N-terminal domain-containing protein [Thermoanaerobaculia bacterium]